MHDYFGGQIGIYGTVYIVIYVIGGYLHRDWSGFSTSVYEESI